MKFDPLVKSENNQLFVLADNSKIDTDKLNIVECADAAKAEIPADKKTLTAVKVQWSKVEMSPGAYNEELLAALREYLKKLQDAGCFAFIIPSAGKELKDSDEAETFIAAMVHTARRIKDAESVVGFAVAEELLQKDAGKELDENSYSQWFVNDMNVKHGHYVYFIDKASAEKNNLTGSVGKTSFVLY